MNQSKNKQNIDSLPANPLDEGKIDALGHIVRAGRAQKDDTEFNDKIDVFSVANEGDRAQIYQMWAVDKFASNKLAYDAAEKFGLVGDNTEKEKWTQLLEHIAGVTAIADHLEGLLEEHGAERIERTDIEAATLFDNLNKPQAVEAGLEMQMDSQLETAVLLHDIEKPAEIAAAKEMAKNGAAGGLENSRDNPVLREGRLWSYLHEKGASDEIILASQNTGRSDRFFGEFADYEGDAVKKAIEDREKLAELMGVERDVVDAMTPSERRRSSIEAKGRLAALVGISDALAAQFRFRGMTEEGIDAMSAHYLTYKKDPESVAFFGKDWPEYYKEVRRYLIDQVPEENREAFIAELDTLTEHDIFNKTVLPALLGKRAVKGYAAYERLRYPEVQFQGIETWTVSKGDDPEKNEDQLYAGADVAILADGATDKTGIEYPSGKTGGRELAEIAVKIAKSSSKTGYDLADQITWAVREFYKENNPDALNDPSKRAATTLVTARIIGDELVITQIGDTNVRLTKTDGSQEVFTNDKLVDTENAEQRSQHIQTRLEELDHEPSSEELAAIIASGRDVIQERLNNQYILQNNADESTYGYGTIDGQSIPREFADGTPTNFVKVYRIPANKVAQIELVSDGFYGTFPETVTEAEYKDLHARLHAEDPDKYRTYLSTKPNDDASVVIAHLA